MSNAPQAPAGRTARVLMGVLAFFAVLFGITSTGWMFLMIRQWAVPWSSLAVMGHPPPRWEHPLPPASPPPPPRP